MLASLLSRLDQQFGPIPNPEIRPDVKPFFVGLALEALINYHDLTGDPRIPPVIKMAVDGLQRDYWIEADQGFVYHSVPTEQEPEAGGAAPDLNPLIAPAYAWVYMMTGDTAYRDFGDKVFAAGVESVWYDGGKQFSQAYHWSFDYLKWREMALRSPGPTPTPNPGPTPTPNPGPTPAPTPSPTPTPSPGPTPTPVPAPGIPYTLAVNPSNVAPGTPVRVSWTAPAERPRTDWIGIYARGQASERFTDWKYTNGLPTGSLTFTAPSVPGVYEFRYLLKDGYTSVVASNHLTVTAPTRPSSRRTVSLTAPAKASSFTAPATITLVANASGADGRIAKVSFYRGRTKLGETTAAPFKYTWRNVAAGKYSVTARATDNSGATSTSAAVTVSVRASKKGRSR